ncbi:MAG: Trk system potassium transporter TrkA [Chloroflexi bacterium]|nr:Trk system potassium transporter TrkA [Chloroflexota bacterium]
MYIIVVGAGVTGFRIASLLIKEGHSVTVIEQSESELEQISRQLDAKTVLGSGVTPNVLREADVDKADLLIAATNTDETNMITCFLAKELGAKKTVARVRNPDYTGYVIATAESPTLARRIVRPKTLGIDLIVNPDIITAEEFATILSTLYTTEIYEFAHGLVQIREFEVQNRAIDNKPLRDIAFHKPCTVVVLVRPTETIIPRAETVIRLGNHVYLAAAREFLDEIGAVFSTPKRPARNVVILGGGRIGSHVAGILEQRGGQVKIIEPDSDVCQDIAQKLKRTAVICSEGTDRDFLIEEGVSAADAFVATTANDEINILVGLLVKSLGVPRCLAVISNPGYTRLAEGLGIDVAISPPVLAAGKIVRLVSHAAIATAALLAGEQIEAIEFIVGPTAQITKDKLSKISLPKGTLVAAIMHNHTVTIPQPDSVVVPGDHVLAVCLPAVSRALEELFD